MIALLWIAAAFGDEPVMKDLYPAGGGHFTVAVSTCRDRSALLNGTLANHTDDTWLYIEIQVKLIQASATTVYRLNLERVGPNGATFRQRIDGASDCTSVRVGEVELVSAYSASRGRK